MIDETYEPIEISRIVDKPGDAFRRRMALHAEFRRLMLATVIEPNCLKDPPVAKKSRFRDAISGLFVRKADADARPSTTVRETIDDPPKPSAYLADRAAELARWHHAKAVELATTIDCPIMEYDFHHRAAQDLDILWHHLRSR